MEHGWLNLEAPSWGERCVGHATQEQVEQFAHQLADRSAIGDALVYLVGDLGAGKTTLVRHILRRLGYTGRVKSPTYALMESYQLYGLRQGEPVNLWAYHFDFYRMNAPQEWEEAGFRDIFGSPGLKLVEWPQKAADALPTPDCVIHLAVDSESTRHLRAKAFSQQGIALLT